MVRIRSTFISDKTLLVGIISVALCVIGFELTTAVVVYVLYDCWIMYQHQLAGRNCIDRININVIFMIPLVFGLISGILLTRKILKEEKYLFLQKKCYVVNPVVLWH